MLDVRRGLGSLVRSRGSRPRPMILAGSRMGHLFRRYNMRSRGLRSFSRRCRVATKRGSSLITSGVAGAGEFRVGAPSIMIRMSPRHTSLIRAHMVSKHGYLIVPVRNRIRLGKVHMRAKGRGPSSSRFCSGASARARRASSKRWSWALVF